MYHFVPCFNHECLFYPNWYQPFRITEMYFARKCSILPKHITSIYTAHCLFRCCLELVCFADVYNDLMVWKYFFNSSQSLDCISGGGACPNDEVDISYIHEGPTKEWRIESCAYFMICTILITCNVKVERQTDGSESVNSGSRIPVPPHPVKMNVNIT